MKPIANILVLVLSLFLLSSSCKKAKSENPADRLPAATMSGKNTFGCLVDGKIFVPKGSPLGGPILACFYQATMTSGQVSYVFGLTALDTKNKPKKALYLQTHNLEIKEGESYVLNPAREAGKAWGKFTVIEDGNFNDYPSAGENNGLLKITHFDNVKQVVSGTFWFNGIHENGEKIEVREGRFDMQFTK